MDNNLLDAEELDFFEKLSIAAKNSGDVLIGKIIENAKEGDNSSLKLVEKAINESRYSKEERLKISDGQFEQIALLVADRIRGVGPTEVL